MNIEKVNFKNKISNNVNNNGNNNGNNNVNNNVNNNTTIIAEEQINDDDLLQLELEFQNAINGKKKYKYFKKYTKDLYCCNCGQDGHAYKDCDEPITSFGVILLSISSNDQKMITNIINKLKYNKNEYHKIVDTGININNPCDIELFCTYKDNIKFLLIKRKHTLGYLEFIRGRYEVDNVDGIIYLFKQMNPYEISEIGYRTFDELWNEMWGSNNNYNKDKLNHQHEYAQSMNKFEKLKNDNDGYLNLNFYVDNVKPLWENAEWGFPKGRRNYKENNIECAVREFKEEAGYTDDEFIILDNIEPLEENLIGTNGINYRHIYYIGLSISNKSPNIDPSNIYQYDEIGDISFFSYEESMKMIRPYHIDKKRILSHIYVYIMNNIIGSSK